MEIRPNYKNKNLNEHISNYNERIIYALIKQINLEGICFFSLRSSTPHGNPRHDGKANRESDFVFITQYGILILEVKGGQVKQNNGFWFVDGDLRNEAPHEQAIKNMYHFWKFISDNQDTKHLRVRGQEMWCLAFPSMDRTSINHLVGSSTECPSSQIASKEDVATFEKFEKYIRGMINYQKKPDKQPWTLDEIRKVQDLLRPHCSPRIFQLRDDLDRHTEHLVTCTTEQYKVLDYVEDWPRVIVEGCAGSGKTFLAMELLRRNPESSLLILHSQDAVDYFRRQINDKHLKEMIISIDDIRSKKVSGSKSLLIIDEGQLFTNTNDINSIFSYLKGGVKQGEWYWFCDPNYQTLASIDPFEKDIYGQLIELTQSRPIKLKENVRNTKPIIEDIESSLGIEMGQENRKFNGTGESVYYTTKDGFELASQIKDYVHHRLDKGATIGEFIFLHGSTGDFKDVIEQVANLLKVPYRNWSPNLDLSEEFINISSIKLFRGLESRYVVVYGLEEDTKTCLTSLYLGLTRATYGAFIQQNKSINSHFKSRLDLNI